MIPLISEKSKTLVYNKTEMIHKKSISTRAFQLGAKVDEPFN